MMADNFSATHMPSANALRPVSFGTEIERTLGVKANATGTCTVVDGTGATLSLFQFEQGYPVRVIKFVGGGTLTAGQLVSLY